MTEQELPVNQPLTSQLASFQQAQLRVALYINKLFEGLESNVLQKLEQKLEKNV